MPAGGTFQIRAINIIDGIGKNNFEVGVVNWLYSHHNLGHRRRNSGKHGWANFLIPFLQQRVWVTVLG